MKIKLWGTRGSIPTPSAGSFLTSRYGGDTTCFSIETADQFIIIDGGSGLRLQGLEFMNRQLKNASFFFTHVHWDHIQGFPFFLPAFVHGNTFNLYGPHLASTSKSSTTILEKALRGQQQPLTFPVQLRDMPATLHFHEIAPEEVISFEGRDTKTIVTAAKLNHPGGCFGYRIEEHRPNKPPAIFAVATDSEHMESDLTPSIQTLAKNADIFLCDAQYTDDEYFGKVGLGKIGWGHSTWTKGLQEAKAAGVSTLLLTHHDPLHDDAFIAKLENEASAAGSKLGIKVQAATQFFETEI